LRSCICLYANRTGRLQRLRTTNARHVRTDALDVHAHGRVRRERIRPDRERRRRRLRVHPRPGPSEIRVRRSAAAVESHGRLHGATVPAAQAGLVRRAGL